MGSLIDDRFKSEDRFPVKRNFIYLSSCGVAPAYLAGVEEAHRFMLDHSNKGIALFADYGDPLVPYRKKVSEFLMTAEENLSFVKNTSEGMSMIAAGYPVEPGDEIISYIHEYPSNHYPWRNMEKRGAKLKLLKNRVPRSVLENDIELPQGDLPVGFDVDELKSLITKRTRIVALSHVQFTSGFAADLEEIGKICRENKIDLIVDAAQSLGSIPIEAEKWGISALASSGWKWLMGPIGSGILLTSPDLRKKISPIMTGASLMKQEYDYLNHNWDPYDDGRMFEYSTSSLALAVALTKNLDDLFLKIDPHLLQREIFRLQDLFLSAIDTKKNTPVLFISGHRSGILSLIPREEEPDTIMHKASALKLIISSRGGYIRIAPHLFNDDREVIRSAEILNQIC